MRFYGETSDEERRARDERARRERGYDVPTVCAGCGQALADVLEWHPWEACEAYRRRQAERR